jgi:hypothetical protein
MKNSFIAILIIIIIALGAYTLTKNKAMAPSEGGNQQIGAASNCGLTVDSPLPGSTVTFPLTINATVDNTKMSTVGCSWTVFEAQAGGVEIKDQSGNVLAQAPLTTTSDWMTTAATPYKATISALSNPSYTGPLTLVFTEDNPSGGPNPDTLSVQVVK